MNKQWNFKKQLTVGKGIKNSVFLMLILCSILFLFLLKTHQVVGMSMFPTLENEDKIFVWRGRTPKRLDIITLKPMANPQESYVKRVIGMPGDTLQLNRNALQISYLSNGIEKYEEVTLTDGVAMILENQTQIPTDQYFVLGDNRDHSNDSRSFGLINKKQIEGVVSWRYYPLNRMGTIK